MSDVPRQRITQTLVELTDAVVAGVDTIDFLYTLTERCVEVFDVQAATILLDDQRGRLNLAAATTVPAKVLELFELQEREGPCLDCFHTGDVVECDDLSEATARWPRFAVAAQDCGFAAVYAMPMRLREQVLGTMTMFRTHKGPMSAEMRMIPRAFTDVATISIVQARQQEIVTEQVQSALNSRIAIEQAKGVLAELHHITPGEAFTRLRVLARGHGLPLHEMARRVALRDDPE